MFSNELRYANISFFAFLKMVNTTVDVVLCFDICVDTMCGISADYPNMFLSLTYVFPLVCLFQPNQWSSHPPISASHPWTLTAFHSPGSHPAAQGLLVIMLPMKKLVVCPEKSPPGPMQARATPLSLVSKRFNMHANILKRCYRC